jgi:hypothetical protein
MVILITTTKTAQLKTPEQFLSSTLFLSPTGVNSSRSIMVPKSSRIDDDEEAASHSKKDDDVDESTDTRPSAVALLQLACGIGHTPEDNDNSISKKHLKLNEDEPWERSLSKLLWDSTSSLHSSTHDSQPSKSTGIFLLEHSESRDLCSEMEHAVNSGGMDDSIVTLVPARPFPNGSSQGSIYRPASPHVAVRDVSLLDSSHDDSASITSTHSRPFTTGDKPPQRCTVLNRSRSTNSALPAAVVAAPTTCHDHHHHRWVVETDETRQDHRYHDVMQRRAHLCLFRQQHRELFSPAHSFDDVTHFSDSINLPYLPFLDEPSSSSTNNNNNSMMLDDSNTVRRLPPRCDTDNSMLVEFLFAQQQQQQQSQNHHRNDDGNSSSSGP